MFKLCFYVPEAQLELVKNALFAANAGKIGYYDCCAWQCKGEGQFRPLAGSNPAIGQTDTVETVVEYKVEMVIADADIDNVIAALLAAHPYEEPAYQYWRVNTDTPTTTA